MNPIKIIKTYELTINNKTFPVQRLGQGRFFTAYLDDKTQNTFLTGKKPYDENDDHSRTALVEFCDKGIHIPNITIVAENDEYIVYKMPYYHRFSG